MAAVAKKKSLGTCPNPDEVTAATASTPSNPWVIDTHVPFVGKIDFENPMEIVIWGGVGASVLLAPGWWKLGIPLALIAVRYQMSRINK